MQAFIAYLPLSPPQLSASSLVSWQLVNYAIKKLYFALVYRKKTQLYYLKRYISDLVAGGPRILSNI